MWSLEITKPLYLSYFRNTPLFNLGHNPISLALERVQVAMQAINTTEKDHPAHVLDPPQDSEQGICFPEETWGDIPLESCLENYRDGSPRTRGPRRSVYFSKSNHVVGKAQSASKA